MKQTSKWKGQKVLSYLGIPLYNKIDTESKLIANLNTFKNTLNQMCVCIFSDVVFTS